MKKLPVSVGILSFKAPQTIDATLKQYGDFLSRVAEAKVFFQAFSETDALIAQKHRVDYLGRPDNVGIQGGMRWVAENLSQDVILYLENDCRLTTDVDAAVAYLDNMLARIQSAEIDIMRLRSRWNPGEQFSDVAKYTKIHKPRKIHPDFQEHHKIAKTSPVLKYLRPFKARKLAARALYIEENPEQVCPALRKAGDIYIGDSCALNWTNQSIMMRRQLFLDLLDYADAHPSSRTVGGMQDMEKPLNCRWWRRQHFRIGVGDGIFTHHRLDR